MKMEKFCHLKNYFIGKIMYNANKWFHSIPIGH